MRVAYHYPAEHTIYAQRTIHRGFSRAFEDLGHSFATFTPSQDLVGFLERHQPELFITASHFFYRKQLDYELLERYRRDGMVMLTKLDFWRSPLNRRVNEARSLEHDREARRLIGEGLLGDHFFHVVEQGDARMDGFEAATGRPYATIPLAADRTLLPVEPDPALVSELAFVGSRLPTKRRFFDETLLPMGRRWNLKIYGQDWTAAERAQGRLQKVGQFYNLPWLRSLQKPKLSFAQELAIYRSSSISVNVHENYQLRFGGDCNERTFKIPLAGGFEITDDVACIRRYLVDGEEIVIARTPEEWWEKVAHYAADPDARAAIAAAGHLRVLRDHTYHNRAAQMLDLAHR